MDYRAEYEKWLHSDALNDAEKAELRAIENDDKEIESRFYAPLSFGTAGLRGTMAVGLHNMNVHVIRWATEGFARVIAAEGEEAKRKGVAICMDCRLNGMDFARATAEVFCGNGIRVRIFEALRPTPELSFAVREYGCQAGVNVTASHNPKEYNGYKVYWADGAQLPPRHADKIADELTRIDIFKDVKRMPYDEAVKAGMITVMGEETDEKFLAEVMNMVNDYEVVKQVADDFKVVYTPFHGCGYKLVPEALKRLGVEKLFCVAEQMEPDGNFPNGVPNPMLLENRRETAGRVVAEKADLGVSWDGDFDRCFLFDAQGNFVDAYYIIGLLAEVFLAKEPGAKIMYDPRLRWNVEETVERLGGKKVIYKSGHAFMKECMRKEGVLYGGESSAHHYFRDFTCCDSGMLPWLLVYQYLSVTGKSLQQAVGERMAMFPVSGEINRKVTNAPEILARIKEKYADGIYDDIDGVSVAYAEWRFNVRTSNTEPVMRLNVETRGDKKLLEAKTAELLAMIGGEEA